MRIKKRADFLKVQQKGKKIRKPAFTMFYLSQASLSSRIGYTASKKVGNAVYRNLAKRRMRALFHEVLKEDFIKNNFIVDVVVIAHSNLPHYSYQKLKQEFADAVLELKQVYCQENG